MRSRHLFTLALAGNLTAASIAFAQTTTTRGTDKPPVPVQCPVTTVTVGVEVPKTLPAPWWDTPFVMTLDSTALTTVGGKPGMLCVYKGSGRDWQIARPLAPDYRRCTASAKAFSCVPQ